MSQNGKVPKLYLLNYADDRLGHKGAIFKASQQAMNESARKHGIEHIVSWSWQELAATEFYRAHQAYFDRPYHLNGFIFKPFITLRLLEKIDDGDMVLYYDSGNGGHLIEGSLEPLVKLCAANQGTVFQQWGEKNSKWTKRDCFFYMNCDTPHYHNSVALQATWFVLQKTEFAMKFMCEWLACNLDERMASYDNRRECGLPDLPGFEQNRGDQSIFTNLAIKYGVRTFPGAGGLANRRLVNFVNSLSLMGSLKAQTMRRAKLVRSSLGRAKRALAGREKK